MPPTISVDLTNSFAFVMMPIATIPKILREKLSEEGTEALIDLLNKSEEDVIITVEEKFEHKLSKEISELRTEMHDQIGKVRVEVIKWMFIFIFGQFWAIIGVLFAFFRK